MSLNCPQLSGALSIPPSLLTDLRRPRRGNLKVFRLGEDFNAPEQLRQLFDYVKVFPMSLNCPNVAQLSPVERSVIDTAKSIDRLAKAASRPILKVFRLGEDFNAPEQLRQLFDYVKVFPMSLNCPNVAQLSPVERSVIDIAKSIDRLAKAPSRPI